MQLEEGKTYTLYSVDIATDTSGRDYIEAYDDTDFQYRIYNLMNCQRNDLPHTIRCIALTNKKSGILRLVLDTAFYYRGVYDEDKAYIFTVRDKVVEGEKGHYLVEDDVDVFYYPFSGEPKHQIGDDIILVVSKITDDGKVIFKEPKTAEKEHKHKTDTANVEAVHEALSLATTTGTVLPLPEENDTLELKSSLVFNAESKCDVAQQTYKIIRVLASFMNTKGGTLYIGVHDKTHEVLGIENDFAHLNKNPDDNFTYKEDVDGYQNLIRNRLGALCQGVAQQLIKIEFPKENGVTYCKITVKKAQRPIWVNGNQLWVRDGNSTRQRRGDDISFFIAQYDIFERGGASMTQDEMVEAMRKVLNPDFGNADATKKSDDIVYHITWYSNCSYKKTKNKEVGDDIRFSLPVYRSVRDGGGVVLFCYADGRVNAVDLKVLVAGMNLRDKPKNRAYSSKSDLLQIYITLPSNILAVMSIDEHGTQNAKAHEITHISKTQGGGNQGAIFVPSPCTHLQYKLIDAAYRHDIKLLIFPANQTSQKAGYPVNSPTYKDEIDKLLEL